MLSFCIGPDPQVFFVARAKLRTPCRIYLEDCGVIGIGMVHALRIQSWLLLPSVFYESKPGSGQAPDSDEPRKSQQRRKRRIFG